MRAEKRRAGACGLLRPAAVLCGCGRAAGVIVRATGDVDIWAAVPIDGLGGLPMASFESLDLRGPNLTLNSEGRYPDVKFPRGRHEPTRTYIGLEMWNSRGDMPPRRAILAMLGDPYAYYESPLFTAYKLLALGRSHELPERVRRNAGELWAAWDYGYPHGYRAFWSDLAARTADGEGAFMKGFPRAESEAEAVLFARALLDRLYSMPVEQLHDEYLGYKEDSLSKRYSEDPFYRMVDPSFMVFSMLSYRNAAQMYGRAAATSGTPHDHVAVLALAPEARLRGMDGNFFKLQEVAEAWKEDPEVLALTQDTFAPMVSLLFDDMCICSDEDFSEVFTPGYHLPEHILGIEAEGRAYYLVERAGGYGGGSGSYNGRFVAILEARGRCVTQLVANGPFYFCTDNECRPEDNYCGPVPVVPVRPLERIPASGAIYAVPRDGGNGMAAASAAAAAAARALLAALNGPDSAGNSGPLEKGRQQGTAGPAEFLLDLMDLDFTAGGFDVYGVLAGSGGSGGGSGESEEILLSTAALARPPAEETLRVRADAGLARQRRRGRRRTGEDGKG